MDHLNGLPAADAGVSTAVQAARIEGEKAGKIVGEATGEERGKKLGATEERDRIGAIMSLPEAANRRETALKLALDPAGYSADTVKGTLAALPEEKPAASGEPAKPGAQTPPVGQRESGPEIGNDRPTNAAPEAVKAGWKKAFGSRAA